MANPTLPEPSPFRPRPTPYSAFSLYADALGRVFFGRNRNARDNEAFRRHLADAIGPAEGPGAGDEKSLSQAFNAPFYPGLAWLGRAWRFAFDSLPSDARPFLHLAKKGYPLCSDSPETSCKSFWVAADRGLIDPAACAALAKSRVFSDLDFGLHSILLWAYSRHPDPAGLFAENRNAAYLLRNAGEEIDAAFSRGANQRAFIEHLACAFSRMPAESCAGILAAVDLARSERFIRRWNAHAYPISVPYSDWLPELAGQILGSLYLPEHPPEDNAIACLSAIAAFAQTSRGSDAINADLAIRHACQDIMHAQCLYADGTPGAAQACGRLDRALQALFPGCDPDELAHRAAEAGAHSLPPYREGLAISPCASAGNQSDPKPKPRL